MNSKSYLPLLFFLTISFFAKKFTDFFLYHNVDAHLKNFPAARTRTRPNPGQIRFFVATTKNNKSENLAGILGSFHVDAHKKMFCKKNFQINI